MSATNRSRSRNADRPGRPGDRPHSVDIIEDIGESDSAIYAAPEVRADVSCPILLLLGGDEDDDHAVVLDSGEAASFRVGSLVRARNELDGREIAGLGGDLALQFGSPLRIASGRAPDGVQGRNTVFRWVAVVPNHLDLG